MKFVRYVEFRMGQRLGAVEDERVYDVTDVAGTSMLSLIEQGLINNPAFLDKVRTTIHKREPLPLTMIEFEKVRGNEDPHLVIPFYPPEVWAVGVTYKKTADLHEEDMKSKRGVEGIYAYVYGSIRPEIFFKALPQHCAGPGEPFGIRSDSSGTIIEAELAFILDKEGSIVAYTAANDVTAWDIETECPLFLTQAKIFRGSCVLGPAVVPAVELVHPDHLGVTCQVTRKNVIIFRGEGTTGDRKRTAGELTHYLLLNNSISNGTVLCTGTAVGMPNHLAVEDGDEVTITVEGIGSIRNRAKKLPWNNGGNS